MGISTSQWPVRNVKANFCDKASYQLVSIQRSADVSLTHILAVRSVDPVAAAGPAEHAATLATVMLQSTKRYQLQHEHTQLQWNQFTHKQPL